MDGGSKGEAGGSKGEARTSRNGACFVNFNTRMEVLVACSKSVGIKDSNETEIFLSFLRL